MVEKPAAFPDQLLQRALELARTGATELASALIHHCMQLAVKAGNAELHETATQAAREIDGLQIDQRSARLTGSVVDDPETAQFELVSLLLQSKAALEDAQWHIAEIGFEAGQGRALALEAGLEHLYASVGLMTAQSGLRRPRAARLTGLHALRIATPESETPEIATDEVWTIQAQFNTAREASLQGDHERAETLYAELLDALQALPESTEQLFDRTSVLMNRGINLDLMRRPHDALACFRQALHFASLLPDDSAYHEQRALVLMNSAVTLSALGETSESDEQACEAQDIFERHAPDSADARRHAAVVRMNRGDNHRRAGHLRRAEALYAEAARAFERMPLGEREAAWTDLASLSLSRANNALDQGRLDDADRLAEQTEQWFERLPDGLEKRLKIAGVRQNRALIHRRLGRHVEAERRFKALDALMAQDPVTPREQEQRALVWLNRGENLDAMGRYEHAQYCHAQAQKIYDALPPGLDATLGGVNARINGAMTLGAQGRFDEAEHAFDAIDRLLEPLPRLAEVETARFSTALNRANNLQALARPEAAADVLERAAVSLRELGTEEELPFEYANLLTNQGVNATIACEYPAANAYLRRALTLAAALPNSDRSSMHRIVVWTNLMANALADRHINSAASMWPKCFRRLQALQGHPDAQLPEVATSLMQALVELGETGAIEAEECARRAMMLCNWSLDWLDMVNDPLDEKPPGAGQMATVFGLALGWMYGNFQSLLPELLSAQFGRFAAAIRQSSEESAACERDETHPVSALRRSIHRISGELQALETAAQTDDVNDAYDTATRVQALRAQREADVLTLRGALRNLRQSDGFADTITLERMHLAAGGPRGLRNRVLIVLFRFLSTEPAGKDGRTLLRPTAGALVVGPVSAFVTLPSLVLDVALHGRTTQAWPTAGVSPELVSDHLAGSPALNGAHTESHEMNADGWFLRRAVEVGWDAIRSRLSCVLNDVFIATHHELGHLPWQILNEHTPVRVFHGIALAINALERTEATRVIEPPGVDRPLGVLAHSPPNSGAYDASSSRATPAHAIPGVYADLVITRMQWPGASETLSGKEELLQHAPPLIQLSCHGNARIAHTGLEHDSTSAYELARVMSARAGSQRFEAVLTVACASAQAGTNAFGEAGGWSVALHGHVDAVLGALYPVDDVLCSLFVLLLHRSWAERRDLRLALDATRSRLRCGQWADSPAQEDHIHRQWTSALTEALARTSASVSRACAVIERANDHYANRDTLYLEDERLRLITEGFVILG